MKNVVVFKEPKLKPLPPSVTPDVMRNAPLPVRLEAAKTAIAACYDLSELKDWKDKAAAIAAAAKAAKMPDLAKGANRVCKEAMLRLGELLREYSALANTVKGVRGAVASDRMKAASAAGITRGVAVAAVRFAGAKEDIRNAVLADDRVTATSKRLNHKLARLGVASKSHANKQLASEAYYEVVGLPGQGHRGLTIALAGLRAIKIASVHACAPDEKKKIRDKVVEALEMLDAIDEAASK